MKQFLGTSLATYALMLAGVSVFDPGKWCSTLVCGFGLFTLTPVVMAGALLAVCLPLCVLVLVIGALFSWGRPSGAPELVGEILALPLAVVPGYVAALRRVRSGRVWGFVAGSLVATLTLLASLIAPLQF